MVEKSVLMIHDYPPIEGGGLEVNTFLVARYFAQKGWKVTIATSRLSSETFLQKPVNQKDGVGIYLLTDLVDLSKLIDQHSVVHIHLTFSLRPAAMEAMRICQKIDRKFVVTLHTNFTHLPFSALARLTISEQQRRLSQTSFLLNSPLCLIIAPSPSIQKSLNKLGVDKTPRLIRHGLELNQLKNLAKGEFAPVELLTIGEVSLMKGLNYLLDALKILKADLDGMRLRIVGNGPDLGLLKRQVYVFGLENRVEFYGYIPHDQIFDLINSCQILIQPSLTEVCPLVVLEALALGKLVIASDLSGLAEVLGFGKYGLLFQTGNAFDLAKKIRKGLQDSDLRRRFGQKGQAYVKQNFSIERQLQKLKTLYQAMY